MGKRQQRKITCYDICHAKVQEDISFAVVADLHDGAWEDMEEVILQADAVLIPGDLVNRYTNAYTNALNFLRDISAQIPVFYSRGNHERRMYSSAVYELLVSRTDAIVLDNTATVFRGIGIGGLSSMPEGNCDTAFLDRFEQSDGFRLLLCHHPEVYRDHVAGRNIDLSLAGHAHGGQIQLFGHGLYAPGQGVFPRLTDGYYFENRLIVSRGMTNSTPFIPRFGNPCELLMLTLRPERNPDSGY